MHENQWGFLISRKEVYDGQKEERGPLRKTLEVCVCVSLQCALIFSAFSFQLQDLLYAAQNHFGMVCNIMVCNIKAISSTSWHRVTVHMIDR